MCYNIKKRGEKMNEILEMDGQDFVSYDLLCNIGSIQGYGNINYLKSLYPDMPEIKNGAYDNPNFTLDKDVDILLEKDDLGAEAIWLKVGSRIEEEISVCLENEPVLSQKHMLDAENELIQKECDSRYTVLNELISDMPESVQDKLDAAIEKNNGKFNWKGVIGSVIENDEDFYIKPLNGSSEVSVVIRLDESEKIPFEKAIEKESDRLLSNKRKIKP